jgi:hypothetical protein
MEHLALATEEQRRRAIAWAVALTADTALAPDHYEVDLLERYAQGELTLLQILDQLDNRIQHLLYRSKATHPLTTGQLAQLVEQAQQWNEKHQLTGLLCYSSDGYFVQVLEGPAPAVHALYANIQRDNRHGQVTTLSDKASATRWFADWKMALIEAEPADFFWLIGYLEAKVSNLVKPTIPITDPQLLTLLKQFSKT